MPAIGSVGINIAVRTDGFSKSMDAVDRRMRDFSKAAEAMEQRAQGLERSFDNAATAVQALEGISSTTAFAAGALIGRGGGAERAPAKNFDRIRNAAGQAAKAVAMIPAEMQRSDGVMARKSMAIVGSLQRMRDVGVGGLSRVRMQLQEMSVELDRAANRATTLGAIVRTASGTEMMFAPLVKVLQSLSGEMTFLSTAGVQVQNMFGRLAAAAMATGAGAMEIVFAAHKVMDGFRKAGVNLEAFGITSATVEKIIGKLAMIFDTLFGKVGVFAKALGAFDDFFASIGADFRNVEIGAGGLAGVLGRLETRMSALIGAAEGVAGAHSVLSRAFAIRSPWEATTTWFSRMKNSLTNHKVALRNLRAEYRGQVAVIDRLRERMVGSAESMTFWQRTAVGLVSAGLKVGAAMRSLRVGVDTYSESVEGKAVIGTTKFIGRLTGLSTVVKAVGVGFRGLGKAAVGGVKGAVAGTRMLTGAVKSAAKGAAEFANRWMTVSGLLERSVGGATRAANGMMAVAGAATRAATALKAKMAAGFKAADAGARRLTLSATTLLKPLAMISRLALPLLAFGAFAEATAGTEKFSREIRNSAAIMTGAKHRMDDLREAAKSVAAETRFSAIETAQGLRFLGQAGFNVDESIAALPVAAKFAQAAMDEMGESTDKLTDIMLAFNLPAGTAEEKMRSLKRVGDVLIAVQSETTTSATQLADALGNKAAGAARVLGMSFEETSAILGTFAGVTIKGEKGGQQLTQVLIDLADGITKHADGYRKLNIRVEDGMGGIRKYADIVEDVTARLNTMSVGQKFAALELLGFTKKSKGAFLQVADLADMMRRLEDVADKAGGTMDRVTEQQMTPFEKGWAKLRVAILDFGEGAFQPVIDQIGRAMGGLGETMLTISRIWSTGLDLIAVQARITGGTISKTWAALPNFMAEAGMVIFRRQEALWTGVKQVGSGTAAAVQAAWSESIRQIGDVLPLLARSFKAHFEVIRQGAVTTTAGMIEAFKAAAKLEDPIAAFQRGAAARMGDLFGAEMEAVRAFGDLRSQGEMAADQIGMAAHKAFAEAVDEGIGDQLFGILSQLVEAQRKFVKASAPDETLLQTFDELSKKLFGLLENFDPAAILAEKLKKGEKKAQGEAFKIGTPTSGVAAVQRGSSEAFSAVAAARRAEMSPINAIKTEAKKQSEYQRSLVDEAKKQTKVLRDGTRVVFADY